MKAAILAFALVLGGCATVAEQSIVGRYVGERLSSDAPEPLRNLERGLASAVSLEVRPDSTFHMVAALVPIDGTWSASGDTLILKPTKVLGFEQDPSKLPADIRLRIDGTKLVPLDQNSPVAGFHLKRE